MACASNEYLSDLPSSETWMSRNFLTRDSRHLEHFLQPIDFVCLITIKETTKNVEIFLEISKLSFGRFYNAVYNYKKLKPNAHRQKISSYGRIRVIQASTTLKKKSK